VALRSVQSVDWHRRESGIDVDPPEGLALRVTWRPTGTAPRSVEVLLVHSVRDIEAGLLPEAGILVLLAGGVRPSESLDIYLVGADGRYRVFETHGGARLPARFNDGLGSWPIVEDEHLILLAYQREGRIEFRATDLRGQLFAMRSYGPKEPVVTGMRAEADPLTNEVRVFFTGDPAPLLFPHPLAPRVELSPALVDFGVVGTGGSAGRELELHNVGSRPLQLAELELEDGPFQVEGTTGVELAPAARTTIALRFRPVQAGPQQVRLYVHSNAANPRVAVTLRGEGAAAAARSEPVAVQERPPEPKAQPPAAPSASPPPAPRLLGTAIETAGKGRVRVAGMLLAPAAVAQLRVRASNGGVALARVGASGAFQVELQAGPGDVLHAMAIGPGGKQSPERMLGRVLPALMTPDGRLEVLGPPYGSFVLLSVVPAPDGDNAELVLDAWEGALGPDGRGRIDAGSLGPGPLWLVALVKDQSGPARRTNLILWRRG